MTIRLWALWGLAAIGIAIVGLLAFNAYAILGQDGEPSSQLAQPNPTATPTAEQLARLNEAMRTGCAKLTFEDFP